MSHDRKLHLTYQITNAALKGKGNKSLSPWTTS